MNTQELCNLLEVHTLVRDLVSHNKDEELAKSNALKQLRALIFDICSRMEFKKQQAPIEPELVESESA